MGYAQKRVSHQAKVPISPHKSVNLDRRWSAESAIVSTVFPYLLLRA